MRPAGTPTASAAICVNAVYAPVPMSTPPLLATSVPSPCSVALAEADERFDGYVEVAIPIPSSIPSGLRIERGCGLRRDQPKRSAACA